MKIQKSEREVPLRLLAQELGCSLTATYTPDGVHREDIVIHRIREAAAAQHGVRWSWLTIISVAVGILGIVVTIAALLI
jgi:hypothetical protein